MLSKSSSCCIRLLVFFVLPAAAKYSFFRSLPILKPFINDDFLRSPFFCRFESALWDCLKNVKSCCTMMCQDYEMDDVSRLLSLEVSDGMDIDEDSIGTPIMLQVVSSCTNAYMNGLPVYRQGPLILSDHGESYNTTSKDEQDTLIVTKSSESPTLYEKSVKEFYGKSTRRSKSDRIELIEIDHVLCEKIRQDAKQLSLERDQLIQENNALIGSFSGVLFEPSEKFRQALHEAKTKLATRMQEENELQKLQSDRRKYGTRTAILHLEDKLKKEESRDILTSRLSSLIKEKTAHCKLSALAKYEMKSPFSHRPILNSRYLFCQLLGKGGFCEVWKIYDLKLGKYVAAKPFKAYSAARNEFAMQSKVTCPEIVQILEHDVIIGTGDFEGYSIIIMELCEQSVGDLLFANNRIEEGEARKIIVDVMNALLKLNSHPIEAERIVHGDMKPENLLIAFDGTIKVADFGLAMVFQKTKTRVGGTLFYLPPEYFDDEHPYHICSKVDVWSVGIIFYQLVCGVKPFGEGMKATQFRTVARQLQKKELQFPDWVPQDIQDFIRKCLVFDPAERPTIHQLANLS